MLLELASKFTSRDATTTEKGDGMSIATFTNREQIQFRDDEIVDRAYACLDCHPHFKGRSANIQICCEKSTLVLAGRLPSYFLKQILQSALKELDGVSEIKNDVSVFNPIEN